MSSGDDSQSSDQSSHLSGYIPDDDEEEEEIEKQTKNEVIYPGRGVLLSYHNPDLVLGASEVEKMQRDDLRKLLEDKKLILILNLEHTLINSVLLQDLTDAEKPFLDLVEMRPGYLLRKLDKHHMLVKLRPYIHKFLKKANNMFEMFLFTTREQDFLYEVLPLLDPNCVYFTDRIFLIPPDDNNRKINFVFDAELGVENAMIILDDNKIIWKNYTENHIVSPEYNFFAYSVKGSGPAIKSWSQLGRDEATSEGVLKSILHVLRRVHERFYAPEPEVDFASRDVRVILDSVRKNVLGDCNILFNEWRAQPRMWKLAEGMGAICSTDMNDSVTHVVTADPNSKTAIWARENNKFLITAHWIVAAHYFWKRKKEEKFPWSKKLN